MTTAQINPESCRDASSLDERIALRLLGKYAEIAALRTEHDEGREHDVVLRLRRLSASFPGSLRELDRLSRNEIAARTEVLRAVIECGAQLPRWALVVDRFHASLRVLLHQKGAHVVLMDGDPTPAFRPTEPRSRERSTSRVASAVGSEYRMAGRDVEALLTSDVCHKPL